MAAFDVRTSEAALRLHSYRAEETGEKFTERGVWGGGGQRRIEKTQLSSQGETHTATQSLALQMLAIGSVKGVQAFRAEFEYCPRAAW